MFRKSLAVIGAIAALFAAAVSPAFAAGGDDAPGGNAKGNAKLGLDIPNTTVGDKLCGAPWHWTGPGNVGAGDGSYNACNRPSGGSDRDSGINILNDACLAPWQWNGPLSILSSTAPYNACNEKSGKDMVVAPKELTLQGTATTTSNTKVGKN
ncbi:hypothetical protein [Streptomyces sp. NBC_01304]|uniref:hypothetical protein n=1 Tax=Streptomyces sp. NBC_01304 TaxID=2903818 RepID=UPI002E0D92F5|nr:hypothetical protein OG430_10030 [Streptomyces sp. NBC_01304]